MGAPTKALLAHMHERGYVTTTVAAKQAMVSVGTIHAYVKAGRLKSMDYGGRSWISTHSLHEVMAPLRGET